MLATRCGRLSPKVTMIEYASAGVMRCCFECLFALKAVFAVVEEAEGVVDVAIQI